MPRLGRSQPFPPLIRKQRIVSVPVAGGSILKISTIAWASVKKVSTIAEASISKVATIEAN
jgi:hypothetical protein